MLTVLFLLNGAEIRAMSVAFWAALVAFCFSLLFKDCRRDKTLPTAFLCVMLSVCLLGIAEHNATRKIKTFADESYIVSGTLCDLPYQQNGRYYYPVKTDFIEGEKVKIKVRLVSSEPLDLEPHDRVTAKLHLFALGAKSKNPSVQTQYKAKGFLLGASLHAEQARIVKGEENSLFSCILNLRHRLALEIESNLPAPENGVLAAMSLGTSRSLSKEVQQQFRSAGVSHLLVVSGLHLSIYSGILVLCLEKLRLHRKKRALIGLALTACITVLTGGAPSVLRAACMLSVLLLADLFSREADALNSLGIALFLMLLINPFAAKSLSLLLSSLATLGILLFAKPIERALLSKIKRCKPHKVLHGFLSFCISTFAVTTAVTICTLPVQMLAFGTFTLFALLANFLLVPLAGMVLLFTVLGAFFSLFSLHALSTACFFPAFYLAKYMIFITAQIAKLPFAVVPVSDTLPKILLGVSFLILAILCLLPFSKERFLKPVAGVLAVLFLLGNLLSFGWNRAQLQIFPIETKNGTCVLLHTGSENILLSSAVDNYADYEICAILYTYGAKELDAVFVPTEKPEAMSLLHKVSAQYPIKTLYVPQETKPTALPKAETVKPLEKEVLHSANGKLTLLFYRQNGANYAEINFGQFRTLLSFSKENNFKGDGATLFMTAEPIPKQGFEPKAFSHVLLCGQENEADFLSLYTENLYTLSQNPMLVLTAQEDGTLQFKNRR